MPPQWLHAEHVGEVDRVTTPRRRAVDIAGLQAGIIERSHRRLRGVVTFAQSRVAADLGVAHSDDGDAPLLHDAPAPVFDLNRGTANPGSSSWKSTTRS